MPRGVYNHKGVYKNPDERGKKIRIAMLGNKRALGNHTSHGFGNKNALGHKRTAEMIKNRDLARRVKYGGEWYSKEEKIKVSERMKIRTNEPEYKISHLNRLINQKFFDTNIEKRLEELFILLKVRYEKQVRIEDVTVADFYLPESKLYIFCDGDYWHNKEDVMTRDERNNKLMKEMGIRFLRFWGKEILRESNSVIEKILNYA